MWCLGRRVWWNKLLKKEIRPWMIRWDLTSQCNLRCKHCYGTDSIVNPKNNDLTTNELKKSIGKISEAGIKYIHFLGGEPTLRADFVKLIKFAHFFNLEISYNTNGIIQNKELIKAIFDYNLYKITFSLDGIDKISNDLIRGKGSFKRTLECIRKVALMKKEIGSDRPEIQIQMVLNKLWYNKTDLVLNFISKLKANSLVINKLNLVGSAKENENWLSISHKEEFKAFGKLLRTINRFPEIKVKTPIKSMTILYFRKLFDMNIELSPYDCRALKDHIYIFADGTIAPCILAHYQNNGRYKPNIREFKPKNGWNLAYFEKFQREFQKNLDDIYANYIPCNRCIFLNKICKPCPISINGSQKPIMYQCLIAEKLLKVSDEIGGISKITEELENQVIDKLVLNY